VSCTEDKFTEIMEPLDKKEIFSEGDLVSITEKKKKNYKNS